MCNLIVGWNQILTPNQSFYDHTGRRAVIECPEPPANLMREHMATLSKLFEGPITVCVSVSTCSGGSQHMCPDMQEAAFIAVV